MSGPTILHARTVNHRLAPTEVRERAHLDEHQAVALMQAVAAQPGGVAVIPVSTCNRTEIYLEVEEDTDPTTLLRAALEAAGAETEVFFSEHALALDDLDAVRHLFRVASALESMMLGEPQISGQLKNAYRLARRHQEPGPILLRAFQGAFRTGKRVRTETHISKGAVSVAFAAVELARKFFTNLCSHTALLVGAGETGALAARHFLQQDIGHLLVVNRSPERARDLADTLREEKRRGKLGEARDLPQVPADSPEKCGLVAPRPWEDLAEAVAEADVILSTTGATEPVILPEMVEQAVAGRKGRPLFLLDIAVPRDVHPDVAGIKGVYLFGLEDLNEIIKGNLDSRRQQVPHAERIIKQELAEFHQWMADVDMRPTVAEFRAYLEDLKDKQVGFVAKKESPEVAAAVDRSLQQFIKKVLGRSVSTLKQARTAEERQQALDTLHRIFGEEPRDDRF